MKSLQLFAIALIATVLSFASALAGCEGGGSDGSSNNGYTEDDSNGSGGEDTNGTLEAGLIVATAPNDLSGKPFVGDFSFDGNVACTQVSVCEFETTGSVKVEFTHPLALFLNKYATANPDEDTQVSWDKPGDWGLAPQGVYLDENAKFEGLVKTWIEDGQVLLEFEGSVIGAVEGDTFSWEYAEYNIKFDGTISSDLGVISYQKTIVVSGDESDIVLKRVE